MFPLTLGHLPWLVEEKNDFQNSKFRKKHLFWTLFQPPYEIRVKIRCFFEILSFESRFSPQQVMVGAPKLEETKLGSLQRFWALFPWHLTLFKNIPQMSQNANKSRIFGHTGGIMSWRGDRQGWKIIFSWPRRSHVLSKKGGIDIIIFVEKVFINSKKVTECPDLK